jgi:hypothetical protein
LEVEPSMLASNIVLVDQMQFRQPIFVGSYHFSIVQSCWIKGFFQSFQALFQAPFVRAATRPS